jgi:hypothetical protein
MVKYVPRLGIAVDLQKLNAAIESSVADPEKLNAAIESSVADPDPPNFFGSP